MIQLWACSRILVAIAPQDFRKGIDGFVCVCRSEFNQNSQNGCVFVFINRAKTMVRLLVYDNNGYWLMSKRLSKGRFRSWPKANAPLSPLMAKELRLLLRNETTDQAGLLL